MKWGNQSHWNASKETIDEWLERENKAQDRAENIVCPHCDHIDREWYEYHSLKDWECEDVEIDCCSCSKKFLVSKETQVRFESKKLETET